MKFDQAFELVVGHEGNLSLDPKDPGNWTGGECGKGELRGTKYGISAAAYPNLNIANLTIEDARTIYRRDYWLRLGLDNLPDGLTYCLFDFGVNSGVEEAAEALQGAVGALRDGNIGPKTVAAATIAWQRSPKAVLRLLFVERAMIFALNPNDKRYGRGWFARLFDVTLRTIADEVTPQEAHP